MVPKRFPLVLVSDRQPSITRGSGRKELADWLAAPANPLTARVMANRIWQWHFGEGIVRTPSNFGKAGERPTHPELLDYLASSFIERGWSIKSMHRLLMLSNTYQMSSLASPEALERDVDDALLSRFPGRRLEVEEIRDSLLALDGSLDLTMGGALLSGRGTDKEFSDDRMSLNPDQSKRRTVYLPLAPFQPGQRPDAVRFRRCDYARRGAVPDQRRCRRPCIMMNSEFVARQARSLASQLLGDGVLDDAGRIRGAYYRVLGRPAQETEIRDRARIYPAFSRQAR